jgi:tight adherence protein C
LPSTDGGVWEPIVTALADQLAGIVDASSREVAERRLRHAGFSHLGVDGYRRRQLGYTVAAVVTGALLAVLLGLGIAGLLVLAGAAGLWGATRWRSRIARAIAKRRDAMRGELYTVCQLLAVYLRTGDTPAGALDRLTTRSDGVVAHELGDAAIRIRSGAPAGPVLGQLAGETAEPSAARLYRVLGSAWTNGGDPDALLCLAEDIRASRREDLTRQMAKRRTAMALPLVMVIGPILILFVAAAIPSLVFGH